MASSVHAREVKFPLPQGFINDYAGILPPTQRARIENILDQVEKKTTAEISVVTVKTTSPLSVEQYAVRLFEAWGIGKKGKDNGILILVASGDRKMRIEVGYGLEGAVTDLESNQIINGYMTPYFKKGDYFSGIYAGVVLIAGLIEKEYGVKLDLNEQDIDVVKRVSHRRSSPLGSLFSLLFFIMIFGFRLGPLFFIMSGNSRKRYWYSGGGGSYGGGFGGFGGGSSGGGFGGFGGGFSGGGGSSGGW